MSKDFPHEKWVKSNSNSSSCQVQVEQEEEEEEEEALSLCDLPINKANQSPKEQVQPTQAHAEFDFGFGFGSGGLGQMCAADEVFFRGQILPFRHSVSSESSLSGLLNPTRSMSRSESMDHSYSGGFRSIPNSRSSSIKSQYSSSSGSSTGYKPRVVRNQFHSHPSPSPQIRSRSTRQGNSGHRNPKSTIWGFFQTGLVRAPEIGLWSIGGNSNIKKSFGSRNSNSSSCSSVSNGKKIEIKKKLRLFDINGAMFGGCKCSVLNAVEVVPSKIVILKEEEKEEEKEKEKEKEGKQKRKQAVSRNRTFEWLKQLSLEGTAEGA